MKKIFALILVFLATISFGQEFQLLDDYLSAISASGKNATLGSTSEKSVRQLLFDVQPALVMADQQVSKIGSQDALVVRTDFRSLNKVSSISNLKSVKAIVINLPMEPESSILLNQQLKQQMPDLQFVYVNCEYKASVASLQQHIKADLPNVVFLYAINIPQ